MTAHLESRLEAYCRKEPLIVFEWHDDQSEARGWVVINSLRGGAAGGGTRMRKGLTRDEVVALAKVMEIKFSVAGPAIGGAKSGIDFDPTDPRRDEVLKRWYQAIMPLLKAYYGTGGDLNVDEMRDVIPITEALGLWHPQEGIVHGHYKAQEGQKVNIIGQLRYGCSKIVEDPEYLPEGGRKQAVADLITGFGVAESVRHYYALFHHTDLRGKRAIIQGWGNVASAAALFLSKRGVRITGIIDRHSGIVEPEGLDSDAVRDLFNSKNGNRLGTHERLLTYEATNACIWSAGAEIFIPGAASRLVNRQQVESLIAHGCEVIACGANVPFVDDAVFFGPTARFADSKLALVPDFIANCGMARVFAYLMQSDVEVTDRAIFDDVSKTIYTALAELYKSDPSRHNLSTRALEAAVGKLMPCSHNLNIS